MSEPPLLELPRQTVGWAPHLDRGPLFPVTSKRDPDGTLQPLLRALGHYERRGDGYHWRPASKGGSTVDQMEYEVLAWLAAGNSVFRPRFATPDAQEAFHGVVALLAQLRGKGLVDYSERHMTQTSSGGYILVGPVELTPKGKAALRHDLRLGSRARRPGDPLPWRL